MKRTRLVRIVREVLDARDFATNESVTFDQLVIDFSARTVTVRGRTIQVKPDYDRVSIPVMSTTSLVVTDIGEVL